MTGTTIYGYKPSPFDGVRSSGESTNTSIGFFSTTPSAQRNHVADPAQAIPDLAAHAAAINLVLEAYGLMKTS